MSRHPAYLTSLVIGVVIVSSLVAVDPGAIALLNVEFLTVAGSVAMAMTRANLRAAAHWLLVTDTVVMVRVGWRMTREDPRCIVAAA
ncbi:hypothetical protein [Aeromicrobium sp. Sec7.5]|uniref:hypothetical protein n=1 Tax=Aeromicrobium sp. Sec7.5 TaxID=3121276 RepID=UPI002FE444BE